MSEVQTVRGPIELAELGPTLMHEHLFLVAPDLSVDYPAWAWAGRRTERVDEAVDRLVRLFETGIRSIVDLTVLGLGRAIDDVAAVAARVPVHIVVATGIYTFDYLHHFFVNRPAQVVDGRRVDVMIDMFVEDITMGIGETGIRAGVLKCCTEARGVTPNVDRVLRAVAQAHRQTGVPISTHSNPQHRTGLEQQRVFAEEGVDLRQVVIGHSGDSTDLAYLCNLMDEGSTIGMDRFGLYGGERWATFEERVSTVSRLCALGYADRMVLSHDANCYSDRFPFGSALPSAWQFEHVMGEVVPALRSRGVTNDQLDLMLVANPRRILQGCLPY